MDQELVATFTLTVHNAGQLYLRVQGAAGWWQEVSLDRYTPVGRQELMFLWRQLTHDLQGENQIPY